MPRIYVPNPVDDKLTEAKKQLYLLRTAIQTEKQEKLEKRIDDIRRLLVEISEKLDSTSAA
jgi:hypothetical protein